MSVKSTEVLGAYPHEPAWGELGAVLSTDKPTENGTNGLQSPEPVGYLEKLTEEQRNAIARGRVRRLGGRRRFIGGNTWHHGAVRESLLDADGKEAQKTRPDSWKGNVDELIPAPDQNQSLNGLFTYQAGDRLPVVPNGLDSATYGKPVPPHKRPFAEALTKVLLSQRSPNSNNGS